MCACGGERESVCEREREIQRTDKPTEDRRHTHTQAESERVRTTDLEDRFEVFEETLPAREVVARDQARPLPRWLGFSI